MDEDLSELYRDVILDHNKNPRNFGKPESANREQEGYNPLCGDRMTIYLNLDGETLRDVHFEGTGCAISKASASVMTDVLTGKSRVEARKIFEQFHAMVTSDDEVDIMEVGEVAALSGVNQFPLRIKCATLAWHALLAAMDGKGNTVSTE